MGRSRVKHEFIWNHAARKASFKKRRSGLLKKMNELTTLCGVDACAIILDPTHDDPHQDPCVWPNPMRLYHVASQYMQVKRDKIIPKRNMLTQESLITRRIEKAKRQIQRLRRLSRQKETEIMMHKCVAGVLEVTSLSIPDRNDVVGQIEKALVDIDNKIKEKETMENKEDHDDDVYRPELPPQLATVQASSSSHHAQKVMNNDQILDCYTSFGEDYGLHLAFGDINKVDQNFWSSLFL